VKPNSRADHAVVIGDGAKSGIDHLPKDEIIG